MNLARPNPLVCSLLLTATLFVPNAVVPSGTISTPACYADGRGDDFQNPELPPDVVVSDLTPVHVQVVNWLALPPGATRCQVSVFNRLPLPTPWGAGPERVTWNVPGGQVKADDGRSNGSLRELPQSVQCQPVPGQVMAWEGVWDAATFAPTSITCDYDLMLARRVFNARKYLEVSTKALEALPPDLQAEVEKVQKSLDPAVEAMAQGQIAQNNSLVVFLQAASNFCGQEIKRGVVDAQGKPISRYDVRVTFQERKGWCGPQSSLFRAFCLAVGIPAREVSGYSLKRVNVADGEINMSDTRGVPDPQKDGNAHVWAEVYFPEVGWIEINVGAPNCFDVPRTFIKVSGIEAPHVIYRNEKGRTTYDSFAPHITVIPE